MAIETVAQLFAALGRDPNELIDEPERQWLDFKGEPHVGPRKTEPHHRLELAKDVTAMGNAGGGVIVLGVRPEKREKEHQEFAKELKPIPPESFDPQQVHQVLDAWVFPSVELEIESWDVPGEEGKLWTLHVHRQSEASQPFLIQKES